VPQPQEVWRQGLQLQLEELQVCGKLGRRRGQLNALGGLIFLQDLVSKQKFLVDTGAAVSVFPHRSTTATSCPLLTGADGKPISAWGKVTKSSLLVSTLSLSRLFLPQFPSQS
jgi:hypothetical protein